MARKRFTAEQIIIKLREAEVGLAQGKPPETTASNGISDPTGAKRLKRPYDSSAGCVKERLCNYLGRMGTALGERKRTVHAPPPRRAAPVGFESGGADRIQFRIASNIDANT